MGKKALIISFSGIGDAVLAEVLCENLKQMYNGIEVDFVVKDNAYPLFLNNPCIDNVIPYYNSDRKKFFNYIKKTWNVMKKKYDIIMDVESTPRSELFSLFGLSAKHRIGWYKISKHKFLFLKVKRGFFYNYKIKRDNRENVIKNLVKFLDPLVTEGLEKENFIETRLFKIGITEQEKKEMKETMEKAGMDFSKKIIICGVNAVGSSKRWKKESMTKVLKYILDSYDYQILLYYTPGEMEYTMEIGKELNDSRVFCNIGTKDVRDLAKLMANSDFFFGNEGGPRHIAQALDIPGFVVFSPNSYKKDWLVNDGDIRFDGIEAADIAKKDVSSMSWEEKYDINTPEIVIEKLKPHLDNLKK